MVDFLAERIARANSNARSLRARPSPPLGAHLGMAADPDRSLEASRANANGELWQPPASLVLSEEEKAIDPSLHVLQLEALDPTRKRMLGGGWLVFFRHAPDRGRVPESPLRRGCLRRHFQAPGGGVATRMGKSLCGSGANLSARGSKIWIRSWRS